MLRPGRGKYAISAHFKEQAAEVRTGIAIAALGNLDGAGQPELLIGEAAASGGGHFLMRVDGIFAGEEFGFVLADGGDRNLDGTPNLLVGPPFRRIAGTFELFGAMYALGGTDGSVFSRVDEMDEQEWGHALTFAGNLDADGNPDFPAGAPSSVLSQPPCLLLSLSGKDGADLRSIEGGAAGDEFGSALAPLSDLGGSGREGERA